MTCVHQLHFVNCSWTSEVPLQSVHKRQVQNKIAKRKKYTSDQSNSYHSCYIWLILQNQDSIQFFWAISSNVTQIPPNCCSYGAICSKGLYGIYYIVGALQKWPNLSKSLTFSFSQTWILKRFCMILLQDFFQFKCRIQNCKRKKPRKYLRCFDAFCRNRNIGIKDNLWM